MTDSPTDNDPVVPNPTYQGYIRNCFTDDDIAHMAAKGIDLGTYNGVKANATNIYLQTLMPNAPMPMDDPPPAPPRLKWSANRSLNFKTWILNQFPMGTPAVQAAALTAKAQTADVRLRKNVESLSQAEIDALKTAFNGIIALDTSDPSNPNSYANVAGIHGYPLPQYCQHHVDPYNPWHRVYIDTFENALRSISGCEQVTLPYWDIATGKVPALFSEPPFDQYTIQTDIGDPNYTYPYPTQRNDVGTIEDKLAQYGVTAYIETALQAGMWGGLGEGGFEDPIMAAHDAGHAACGPTMLDQGVAAYDPIFWFFHCNWERLFWSWQNIVGGTTLTGFTSTLAGNTGWLTFPPLSPWSTTPDQTIPNTGIAYDRLATEAVPMLQNKVGSIDAVRAFTVHRSAPVSVRVKGINRLNIPGTFIVHLLADGEPIANRVFFQPTDPRKCANCKEHGLVNLDMRVDQEKLLGRKLSVSIEVPAHEGIGKAFPLSQVGNPSINARLLLEEA